ncbi:MAG TPA: FtsX-like permease family protein [Actinophytocola sp.]|uniref:FtsX-like permease family protein n=1 Tax=Actinophytocola sp. TaxID=1872138 RepID=UPI002DB93679|nr:FtsX-like permease family protein [Actinophytocola sp.]HEU5469763.1 FtsX-like permease family protein [Actinophytocola sp.]
MGDLRLGVRLAVGGGRTSKTGVARLALGTIGIGLAVAILLVGASAGPMFAARDARAAAQIPTSGPVAGVDPLYLKYFTTQFRGHSLAGNFTTPAGPRHPMPPGLTRLPGDGEIVLSAALAELLASPEGELLRPRFPQRVIGTIGRDGVSDAATLSFYAGVGDLDQTNAQPVYGFGAGFIDPVPAQLVVLLVIGTVVLLVPVFVFIATSARVAGAERDRRLAALRLVGADARQARRIAAAESLVAALTGLVFGVALFLLFRAALGSIPVLGVRPYPSDVSPPWPLVLLIVLVVPGLAVLTAQFALRRTIIEPLGVVRRGRPVRRRLWWRLVPVLLGPVLLLGQGEVTGPSEQWIPAVVAGAVLMLIGIPALLPWLLERVVGRVHGGPPSAQLAVRRLQLDSGTPARVVGGVAVVLAGAIALQAVLSSQTDRYAIDTYLAQFTNRLVVHIDDVDGAEATDRIRSVPGVTDVETAQQVLVRTRIGEFTVVIVDCPVLLRHRAVERCADGDVFGDPSVPLTPGQSVQLADINRPSGSGGVRWTIPRDIQPIQGPATWTLFDRYLGVLVLTPGALHGLPVPGSSTFVVAVVDSAVPDVVDHVRNAMAPYAWRARVQPEQDVVRFPAEVQVFELIRNALLGGALFTLLLAGVSMLVLALEQVRERRRPLAALVATGVPTATLARSLLWQHTIPVLVGVAVAVVCGTGLAALVFGLLGQPFDMDWPSVLLFSGTAAALVLVVTGLTLPTLRGATRQAALRSE